MKEIWKPIKGYEGLYEISSKGRVRSLNRLIIDCLKRKHPCKQRILKLHDSGGYLMVGLSKNHTQQHFLVHRIVAKTFLPNPKKLPEVNHKDENRHNNHVDNLEWCTPLYNSNYGTRGDKISAINTNGKLSKTILQIAFNGKIVKIWPSMSETERNGFSHGDISQCCNGQRHSHEGYLWKYEEDYEDEFVRTEH